jgi:hypothetical protein
MMIARTITIALAVAVVGVAPDGRDPAAAAAVYARMQHVNAALRTYEATVHVDVAMHSFPFISPKLDGQAFFKRPDRNAVVFNTVPALASAFRKIYPVIPPPAEWDSLYIVTPVADDGATAVFRLVPRKHGRVDHIDVEADDKSATVTKLVWNYEEGGSVALAQEYANVNGAYVVSSQSGKVDLPSYKADVVSKFSDYKLNVAVDDKVFEDAK